MSEADSAGIGPLTVLRWLAGPLVWSAHFLLLYGSEWLLCTRGSGASHLAVIALATALAMAAVLATTMYSAHRASVAPSSSRSGAAFMEHVAAALGLLSMLGVLWSALPAVVVGSCMPSA